MRRSLSHRGEISNPSFSFCFFFNFPNREKVENAFYLALVSGRGCRREECLPSNARRLGVRI
jgi:hypothetical protein